MWMSTEIRDACFAAALKIKVGCPLSDLCCVSRINLQNSLILDLNNRDQNLVKDV